MVSQQGGPPALRRASSAQPASQESPLAGDSPVPGVPMHELVDAVVERIERKVVDELERRGQRRGWGAY